MDNIRYKMLKLLVYKHVILHCLVNMSIRMQQAFFFHRAHKKVQRTLSHPT